MPTKRGVPHKGSTGRVGGHRKSTIRDKDGFIENLFVSFRCLIDEWESKEVSGHLAYGKIGGRINHYRVMKNIAGTVTRRYDNEMEWI